MQTKKHFYWPNNRKIYLFKIVNVPSKLQLPRWVNRFKGIQQKIPQLFNCARHDYTYNKCCCSNWLARQQLALQKHICSIFTIFLWKVKMQSRSKILWERLKESISLNHLSAQELVTKFHSLLFLMGLQLSNHLGCNFWNC